METIPSAGANFSSVRHETDGNINASVSIPSFVPPCIKSNQAPLMQKQFLILTRKWGLMVKKRCKGKARCINANMDIAKTRMHVYHNYVHMAIIYIFHAYIKDPTLLDLILWIFLPHLHAKVSFLIPLTIFMKQTTHTFTLSRASYIYSCAGRCGRLTSDCFRDFWSMY